MDIIYKYSKEVSPLKISTKGRYGLTIMMELAAKFGEGPTSLKSIAEKNQLSEHYLEQLIAPLRNAGLVKSIRGAYGGYILSREPASITAGTSSACSKGRSHRWILRKKTIRRNGICGFVSATASPRYWIPRRLITSSISRNSPLRTITCSIFNSKAEALTG